MVKRWAKSEILSWMRWSVGPSTCLAKTQRFLLPPSHCNWRPTLVRSHQWFSPKGLNLKRRTSVIPTLPDISAFHSFLQPWSQGVILITLTYTYTYKNTCAVCQHFHISMRHGSESLKVCSAPRAAKFIRGQAVGEGEPSPGISGKKKLLPEKYTQSNRTDSFCLKWNELSLCERSLMGSNGAFLCIHISFLYSLHVEQRIAWVQKPAVQVLPASWPVSFNNSL